ncbi:ankyrin repeat domain-containing protein [Saccharothrix sp. Mg75]|uniref:ankyrin repeat domain-containing protein n=1 Tax=Saccharothrix sp. Mg75 TaxID=3445357 RepID=UPI003EEFD60B
MPELPARPDPDQLRHRAKDLLKAARRGEHEALARLRAVSDRVALSSAQLAIAHEHGFTGWTALKREVERRAVLDSRDLRRLARLLTEHPDSATTRMRRWSDHTEGVDVLGYVAMLRFDHRRLGLPDELPGTGAVVRALIDAGAPVDGHPGDRETPLITAASYGDAEVARVLVEAGATLEATSAPDSGGVPNGTALAHAAVFGMTEVLDVLVAAGARVDTLEMAAAAGDITSWPLDRASTQSRLRALVFAADHQRLDVVDRLVAAGTPLNQADADWGRLPLHVAAHNGRPAAVRHLLTHGADPALRDPRHHRTPLQWCRAADHHRDSPAHDEVEALLQPLTE